MTTATYKRRPNNGMNLSQSPVCQQVTVITVQVMPNVSPMNKPSMVGYKGNSKRKL